MLNTSTEKSETKEKEDNKDENKENKEINNNTNPNNINNEYDANINSNLINQNFNRRSIENYVTKVKECLTSICGIKSKRLEIGSYATGSDNGYMSLYPNLLYLETKGKNNSKYAVPWKSIKSHRGKITHIEYNKDTNLVFSAGEDGN